MKTDGVALDAAPFHEDPRWIDPDDHAPCQAFGRLAREAGLGLIRYTSVRDPERGPCAAVLTPRAFDQPNPLATTTWMLTVRPDRVIWQRDDLQQRDSFEFEATLWQRTTETPKST